MDIYPLLLLIVVLFVAFWSSIWMLMNVQLVAEQSPEWSQYDRSVVRMLNMGLYTDMDPKLSYHTRDPILVFLYEIYMFFVQVGCIRKHAYAYAHPYLPVRGLHARRPQSALLLNMLIAIMGDKFDNMTENRSLYATKTRLSLLADYAQNIRMAPTQE